MKTFTIDANNNVAVHSVDVWIADDTVKFKMEQELAALAATWPGSRLVEIWNHLPGAKTVTKFTNRKMAVTRIWKAIEGLVPASQGALARKPKAVSKKKSPTKAKPAGGQSKTDAVIAALRSVNGATLKQLMTLTGWQSHSVRGFLSAQVTKRMGLRVKSSKRDGERIYRVRP